MAPSHEGDVGWPRSCSVASPFTPTGGGGGRGGSHDAPLRRASPAALTSAASPMPNTRRATVASCRPPISRATARAGRAAGALRGAPPPPADDPQRRPDRRHDRDRHLLLERRDLLARTAPERPVLRDVGPPREQAASAGGPRPPTDHEAWRYGAGRPEPKPGRIGNGANRIAAEGSPSSSIQLWTFIGAMLPRGGRMAHRKTPQISTRLQ